MGKISLLCFTHHEPWEAITCNNYQTILWAASAKIFLWRFGLEPLSTMGFFLSSVLLPQVVPPLNLYNENAIRWTSQICTRTKGREEHPLYEASKKLLGTGVDQGQTKEMQYHNYIHPLHCISLHPCSQNCCSQGAGVAQSLLASSTLCDFTMHQCSKAQGKTHMIFCTQPQTKRATTGDF